MAQYVLAFGSAAGWHDGKAYPFSKAFVRDRKCRRFLYIWMFDREVLDLLRMYVLAAADDNVLETTDEAEAPVIVNQAEIAGKEPTVLVEALFCRLLIVKIAKHQAGAFACNVTDFALS